MKKYFLLSVIFLTVCLAGKAQDSSSVKKKSILPGKGFRAYTNINLCTALDFPDTIKAKILKSRGADVYLRYSFKFGKSRFGFAPAIGVSSFNMGSNGSVDTIGNGDTTFFREVPVKYKKNKFSVNYAEVPLEFFYESRNKAPVRIAIGFKGGYLMSSHTKFKSSDTKIKEYDIPNLMKYRYGVTFQLTWGWLGVNGFYSLTPVFEKNIGPGFTPYSFGITIAPY